MTPRLRPLPLSRIRYIVLTVTAGAVVGVTAIALAGAPAIPTIAGVTLGVGWLLWRTPRS